MTNSGAMATRGIELKATISGMMASATRFDSAAANPVATPSAAPIMRPAIASQIVIARCLKM